MNPTRRDFLKIGAAAGVGVVFSTLDIVPAAAAPATRDAQTAFRVAPIPTVRMGFVGVVGMGSAQV